MTSSTEKTSHRLVDRTDDHETTRVLAVEERFVFQRRGAIGAENEVAELALLAGERIGLLFGREIAADIQVSLALVAPEVQHLEGTEGLAG